MSTFKDFLVWYNNLDVVPFLEAVEKMSQFWQERKIDMFKDGISVPGLTLKYLFSYLSPQTYFSLFDQANSDLYHLIKDNNTGGSSIISHRYHEADKTQLREAEEGEAAKLCQKIVGYDANALYLLAIMQNMPTGSYTRRLAENELKPKSSIKMAIEWLEWVAHQDRIHIRHQLNNTEKRIGDRKLPVDGFNVESQTVYRFQGCYRHGHDCALNRGKEVNEKRNKPMTELLEETRANTEYIRNKGYRVVEMWECEWRRMKKTNPELQRFIATEVGNSSHGKTITNQLKHRNVEYCSDAEASRKVNTPLFRKLDNITEDTYEVESCKKTIKLNLLSQIGFFVYQYAKLRMLQFYYDFLDKYLDRSDFQMCEMDTDSAYIAIAGESVESLVKPELKAEFEADKCNWFPRTDTPEHKAYDKRTPGLFKVEWEGQGIIGLCSKTYYCFGAKDKFSCKGVDKKCNEINKDKYLQVLLTKQNSSGVNRGFRVVNNTMCTYEQVRDAFSYFYPKRKVLADGVSTTPLDI
ncbi:unnamed protein product [Porites lobata]|uniref:DNA-directed DNA polymerase n=1 Tax=Porites lobata TaxID=104759 RepID=A0ABN8NS65_9CNID|nr:unnamed protein product [Porites lobata]